ncbi:MAG TPA: hypothetical protein VFZ48_04460 [Candidatus Saccharimonadales bacterium]
MPFVRPLEVTLKMRTLASAIESFDGKLNLTTVKLKQGMYCFEGSWGDHLVEGKCPAGGDRGAFKQHRNKHMPASVPVRELTIPSGQLKAFSKALETMRSSEPYQMTLDVWSHASDQRFPIQVVLSELELKGGLYCFSGEWERQPVTGQLWATRRGFGTLKSVL